jgi:hypothetical protein
VQQQQACRWLGILLWCVAGIMPAWGADPAHFQALQLVRFPQAVELPAITLPDLDGKPIALQSFQGQVVLLNFWTTW